ncbi:MAG: riboflavin biosynthesis protein RibF [Ignavibacteria bacterium GWB2_35_6b]|nr:MAG: riboflavin biosynthesis protein RibF [Ignavibacteria bacterium GWB2_35_6b]
MINVFRDISEIKREDNTAVTIGTFDGLHIGHQHILNVLKEKASRHKCRTFVVTFEPHPRLVLAKGNGIKILTPIEEKIKVFENSGVGNLLIINFTQEFSQQTSVEFIENLIIGKIGAKEIVIGYDHKFGKDRGGDESTFRKIAERYNFDLTVVPAKTINGEIVSSTKIRHALNEGDLEKVYSYLNRNYFFYGKVVKGAGRGKTLGFPTANVKLNDENKLIPKTGVYAVKCLIADETVFGVMNIGVRPTFENLNEPVIEVNLFNFDKEIYGENIEIEFLKRIRDEKKFNSKEELIKQIEKDKNEAMKEIG